jgi:hypothetical protein
MLIEFGTEWTLNQLNEFKSINSLKTQKPKTNDEHYWYFAPCINNVYPLLWVLGFQTIETLNSSVWLLLHLVPA